VSETELQALTETPEAASRRSKWLAFTIVGVVVAVFFADPDALVDQVPVAYAIATGALGFAGGLYSVYRLKSQLEKQGRRGSIAMISLPLMSLYIATRLGRSAFEAAAFTGVTPAQMTVIAPVVGMSSGRSGPHAAVKIDPASRELNVSVTYALYAQLDAYRYPGRDCLNLPVQTGRFGIRRAVIPWRLSDGLDLAQLNPCPEATIAWASIKNGS
jgi:multidrug transporter EmrE-like cation transporter